MKLDKEYWAAKYRGNKTSWDLGSVSPPLKQYIDQLKDKSINILLPGAGNSYEAEYLHINGFKNIYVLDIAEEPLKNLKKRIPRFPEKDLIQADFFEFEGSFDLILEQTFFCALPVQKRSLYAKKMHQLLKKNGKLVGLLFNFKFPEEGPPFGGNKKEYLTYFRPYFDIEIFETCTNSILPRQGNELFFIFKKKLEIMPTSKIILNNEQIKHKIKRIAYQIYESNIDETEIILAGISKSGFVFAQRLKTVLEEISDLKIELCNVEVDKKNPLNEVKTSLPPSAYTNKSIVLADDVLNSGATLIYGIKHFLEVPLKQFKTAVLVDRSHKKYPVKADFKGISLSTSFNETVQVQFAKGKDKVELF